MKKLLIYTMLFAGITLWSCESLVDLDPEFTQDAENFFNTPADYQQALIGAYDPIQNSYLTFWLGEIASDNSIAGGESVNDSRSLHEIDNMQHNAVNPHLRDVLRVNYAGITRVNYLFENRDNLDFDEKDRIFAEASFLRAYYYFELVRVFGDVPLVIDRRLGIEEVRQIQRTPAAEVYAQIEADLMTAAQTLEWTSAVKGRATRGAALSLLGRVYLYQDKFDEAATTLDQVINEGPYATISYATADEYAAIFSVGEEGNSESVFEIQFSGEEGGSYSCFVCLEGNLVVGFHGIRQYNGPVYADGNSYSLPTQNLYDAFPAGDMRRDGSILDIEAFIAAQPNAADITFAIGGGGHTGYYNNKYLKRQNELGLPDNDLTSPVNYRAIRYPDVLLMAAEAQNRRSGANEALAQQYLNEVRTRVGLPNIDLTGAALTEAIWAERRLELSGEGFRFFDLVRTGQAADAIEGFVVGKHEVFPIPQIEIDLSGGNWSQNENYN